MGIFAKLRGMFGGGKTGIKSLVVDAGRLVDEKTGRRLSPREQLQLLGALRRVQQDEGFEVSVIFESDRPLREVEEGGSYQGMQVYYAASSDELIEKALKLAKRSGVTLVTSGPNLESRATEARVKLLSCATFRKAFLGGFSFRDGGGDRGRRDRDRDRGNRENRENRENRDGNGDNDGGHRRHRRGGRSRNHGERAPNNGGAPAAPAESGDAAPADNAGGNGGSDAPEAAAPRAEASAAVRNLIDLVE